MRHYEGVYETKTVTATTTPKSSDAFFVKYENQKRITKTKNMSHCHLKITANAFADIFSMGHVRQRPTASTMQKKNEQLDDSARTKRKGLKKKNQMLMSHSRKMNSKRYVSRGGRP